MTTDTLWVMAPLIGLLAGVLSGLLGVGGGLIMVPALVMICALPQKEAQSISLAAVIPIATAAVLQYRTHGNIPFDLRIATLVAVGGVVGTWGGVALVQRIPVIMLRRLFAILMIVVAAKMLLTREPPP